MAVEQTPEAPLKTYRGSCHCGAYIFDVELPEPVKGACECNCSVCYKKGGIWAAPVRPLFVKGDPGTLTSYTFNRKLFNHKVCSADMDGEMTFIPALGGGGPSLMLSSLPSL